MVKRAMDCPVMEKRNRGRQPEMEGWGGNKVDGVGCEKRGCAGQKKVEGHSSRQPLWGGKKLMAKKKKKIRYQLKNILEVCTNLLRTLGDPRRKQFGDHCFKSQGIATADWNY